MTPRRPVVVAHRGASAALPDNSPEAFERAIADGADLLELDVRRTGDDRLVVVHDARVGGAAVGGLTHAELTGRLGRRPPLLDEVLELAAGRAGVDVELKEDGDVARVLAAVRARFPADAVVLTSFLAAVVGQLRAGWPAARAGLIVGERQARGVGDAVRQAQACGSTCVALAQPLALRDGLAAAAAAGLEAYVWTVDAPVAMRALLEDPALGGLVTNVPALAVAVRAAAGGPSGPGA